MFFSARWFVFVAYLVDVDIEYYSPCLFFIMITVVVMIIIFIDFYFGESLQHNVKRWKKKEVEFIIFIQEVEVAYI